jgi:uncharacterized membrane protein
MGLGVAVVLFAFAGYGPVKTRIFGSPLTELAIYNASGEAGFYPDHVPVGGTGEVQVSITNREGSTVTYRLVVSGDGYATSAIPSITLHDGETWRQNIQFGVERAGTDLEVRFELFRGDVADSVVPYRTVRLYLDGIATPVP